MRLTLSLLLCCFVPFIMMGQAPVADFSATPASGCAPLYVTFKDLSTGSPKSWNWNFNNGQLSTDQNPQNVFFPPGTYTITLTVKNNDGIGSVTKTNYVVSIPSPSVSFSADKTLACLPADIQFTDQSVANVGTITSWNWSFSDNTTSTAQNPKHTFSTAGYYDVFLTVKSSNGCSNSSLSPRYIRMVNGVKADFNYSGPSTCTAPFNLAYKNLTSGPGNLTYAWDLGNGSFPTQASPSGTYNTAGTYTVKLKAQSDFGCADSVQKSIAVNGITTSFSSSKDSVCLGSPITFQNTSSATPVKVLWDFGDGTTSTQLAPPAKTYANPGTYTVRLNSTFSNCANSAVKTVTVFAKPSVDFYSLNATGCKAPITVNFINQASDASGGSQWDFGDGSPINTQTTPSHTYTSAGTGTYAVTLTIKDANGCQNSIKKDFVRILAPYVSMGGPTAGVCVGQPYIPSPTVGAIDGVASYLWDFGDGTPAVNSLSPSHAYAAPGIYAVKLVVTTNGGCKDSSTNAAAVQVGNKPVIDFTKDISSICRSSVVTFTNLSTPPGTVLWDFDDGTTSTDPNPKHKFNDTGLHNIKLTVTSDGCTDSRIKNAYAQVQPPLANFGYKADCVTKNNVTFSDSSATNPAYGAISYKWEFGDPLGTISTNVPPAPITFTYPPLTGTSASYSVRLIVTNGLPNACSDTIIKTVRLVNEIPDFTFDKTPAVYCRNEAIKLSSVLSPNIKAYEWIIDGGAPVPGYGGYTTSSGISGNHTVQLKTTDFNDCIITSAAKTFTITGPTALFGVANNGGCKNGNILFLDSSRNSGTGNITKWTFDFGDGTAAQSFNAAPFTHKYADTGIYSVKLTVSENGSNVCVDSFRLTTAATITTATAYFSAAQTTFCPGAPLQFTDSSSGNTLTYNWNFGDGGTASVQNPTHQYTGKDSSYTAKLVVTDKYGCADSLTRNNYINIKTPKILSYKITDTLTLCPPLETKFNFTGKDYESFNWDFGDGGSSTLASTSHFYNAYGLYKAKLFVTGYGGCQDSISANVSVLNPRTELKVTFNAPSACNELLVNFTVTPPGSTKFKFYFGDGGIDSSQQTNFQHLYNLPNLYSPVILLSDDVGCEQLIGALGVVHIYGAVPLFGMDKNKFCDSGTVFFTDYSQESDDKIVTRTIDFGDGTPPIPITGNAVHSYKTPGLYFPAITVTTQFPCTKTYRDTVRIYATPQPVISSDNAVCYNLPINFAGNLVVPDTAITWKWGLGNGQTSSLQNPSATYTDTGLHRITLEATNGLGCKNDTTKDIIVNPLPVITVSGDTSIVVGGVGLTLPLTYSTNTISYNWTPPADLSCTDCPNPVATPKYSTTYTVNVTDANGCVSSRNITVLVSCSKNNFFMPNTFSPNGDGTNERFYPRGTGLNLIQSLRIFNRWEKWCSRKETSRPMTPLPAGTAPIRVNQQHQMRTFTSLILFVTMQIL